MRLSSHLPASASSTLREFRAGLHGGFVRRTDAFAAERVRVLTLALFESRPALAGGGGNRADTPTRRLSPCHRAPRRARRLQRLRTTSQFDTLSSSSTLQTSWPRPPLMRSK